MRKSSSLHSLESTPNPKFLVRPKHILSATSAQTFRFLWFMPSLGVRSPWLYIFSKYNHFLRACWFLTRTLVFLGPTFFEISLPKWHYYWCSNVFLGGATSGSLVVGAKISCQNTWACLLLSVGFKIWKTTMSAWCLPNVCPMSVQCGICLRNICAMSHMSAQILPYVVRVKSQISSDMFYTLVALLFIFFNFAQFLSHRAHICIRMTGKDGGVLTSEETKWKNQN